MHLNVHGCGWHGLSAYFGLEHLDEQTTPMPAPCGCHFSTLMGVGTLGFGGGAISGESTTLAGKISYHTDFLLCFCRLSHIHQIKIQ